MKIALAALGALAACGPPPTSRPVESLPANQVAAPPSQPKDAIPEFEHFHVMFAQDDAWLDTSQHAVELRRRPFLIVVLMREPGGVLVNISDRPDAFNAASAGKPLTEIPGFGETGMAEWLFNKEHSIFVESQAPSYWYYTSDDDHRFDAPCDRDQILVCKRTVEQLAFRDGPSIPLAKAPDELFFVFAKTRWEGTEQVEMARRYVAVEFL